MTVRELVESAAEAVSDATWFLNEAATYELEPGLSVLERVYRIMDEWLRLDALRAAGVVEDECNG